MDSINYFSASNRYLGKLLQIAPKCNIFQVIFEIILHTLGNIWVEIINVTQKTKSKHFELFFSCNWWTEPKKKLSFLG